MIKLNKASVLSRFTIHWCANIYSSAFYFALKACRSAALIPLAAFQDKLRPKEQAQLQFHSVAVFVG